MMETKNIIESIQYRINSLKHEEILQHRHASKAFDEGNMADVHSHINNEAAISKIRYELEDLLKEIREN